MITTARKSRRAVHRTYRHPPKTPKVSWLQRNWRPVYILVNITIDSAAILIAGAAAYAIRNMFVNIPVMNASDAALLILASCAVIIMIALVSGV